MSALGWIVAAIFAAIWFSWRRVRRLELKIERMISADRAMERDHWHEMADFWRKEAWKHLDRESERLAIPETATTRIRRPSDVRET